MSNEHPVIGFDAKRLVRNGSGLGNYCRTLVRDLAALPLQLRLYTPTEGFVCFRRQIPPGAVLCMPRFTLPFIGKSLWRSRGVVKALKRDGVELYHGLSGELPIGLRKNGIRSVVTIHDLIFLRHPEYYKPIDVKIYTRKFHHAVREADHIIAISECTRRDILHYAPEVDPSRISVIYQSCSPRFQAPLTSLHSPLSTRYILSVGTIEPRKNILLAVKALPMLPSNIHLVIVGRHTPYADEVREYAEAHGLSERVHLRHDVVDDELPGIYAKAEAFVYPSRYEGFGIPIIEAISSGLPVVACTGSCLEEAGGPDSLYVDPDDERAMAAALRQVLLGAEGRDERIARSQDYIRRFQGRDVARQVYDLYCYLLGISRIS